MKFVKEVTGEKMAIPAAALKLCGFENGDKAELHALPSAAIILKQKMTAMEVIQAMDALHQLTLACIWPEPADLATAVMATVPLTVWMDRRSLCPTICGMKLESRRMPSSAPM